MKKWTQEELDIKQCLRKKDRETLKKIRHDLIWSLRRMIHPHLSPNAWRGGNFRFAEDKHRDQSGSGHWVYDATRCIAEAKSDSLQYLTGFISSGIVSQYPDLDRPSFTSFSELSVDDLLALEAWLSRHWLKEVWKTENRRRLDAELAEMKKAHDSSTVKERSTSNEVDDAGSCGSVG